MDIEKLKAEFEQSECFKRLEHVAQYTFFEFGAYIKRTDVPADIEKKCGKLITALLFSWSAWKEAKAQAVPEGYVLMPKEIDSFDSPIANALEKGIVRDWPASEIYAAMIEAQE
ncbi:hypothetical protein [Acinetobacter sp.]|uniref:hypothetical protein n=1 Tax=Acinetobacter sp. TaxID=472 RepID=UPI002898EEDB|nr:hypothetical protein [Acinetobacter sp.]